jgi:hypothetical protein
MITALIRLSTVLLLLLMLAAIVTGNPVAVLTSWVGFAALAVVRAP